MASRLVHYGTDECLRLMVLSHTGYSVEASGTSIPSFIRLLIREATDVIAISEDDRDCNPEAVKISRLLSCAPVVLFEGFDRNSNLPGVDLAIPRGTLPGQWLHEIARVIQLSKLKGGGSGHRCAA